MEQPRNLKRLASEVSTPSPSPATKKPKYPPVEIKKRGFNNLDKDSLNEIRHSFISTANILDCLHKGELEFVRKHLAEFDTNEEIRLRFKADMELLSSYSEADLRVLFQEAVRIIFLS